MTFRSPPGWFLPAIVFTSPLLLLLLGLHDDALWDVMGIGRLVPSFADLAAVLAAGEAHAAGLDAYLPRNPFDPFGRPHVYGPWWLVLGTIGLRTVDAWWLGGLLAVMFAATVAGMLRPRTGPSTVMAVLLVCSPPVLLGLERGNNDLIMFVLVATAVGLAFRGRDTAVALAGALIVLAAGLKLYPAVASVVAWGQLRRWRGLIAAVALAVLVAWWGGAEMWRGFQRAAAAAPEPATIYAFGLPVMKHTWGVLQESRLWFVAAILGTGILLGRIFAGTWGALGSAVPAQQPAGACYAAGAATWLFCFVATSNFPYRFVWVLFPATLWLRQSGDPGTVGRVARRQLWLWVAVAWLGAPKDWLVAALVRANKSETPLLAALVGVEQTSYFFLTLLLGAGLAGWAVREWRALRNGPS